MFFLIIVLLIAYAFTPSNAQTTPPVLCATGVHAILIRGQGPGDHLNVMVSMQNLVLQLIPGSSSVALPFHHEGRDHRIVAAEGALMMQDYIRKYVASCPKSKIFLMGYSLVCVISCNYTHLVRCTRLQSSRAKCRSCSLLGFFTFLSCHVPRYFPCQGWRLISTHIKMTKRVLRIGWDRHDGWTLRD